MWPFKKKPLEDKSCAPPPDEVIHDGKWYKQVRTAKFMTVEEAEALAENQGLILISCNHRFYSELMYEYTFMKMSAHG